MTDKPADPARHPPRSRATFLAWGVIALVFYVLSAGPATWLVYRWGGRLHPGNRAQSAYGFVYGPVQWVAEHSPQVVEAAWERYINFFLEQAYRAEIERWLTHPSAQSEPGLVAARQDDKNSTPPVADSKLEPRIAGRTLLDWQARIKEIDPLSSDSVHDVPGLIELVKAPDVPWFTRRQAALVLGRMKSRALPAVPVLVDLLAAAPP